nr:unnamed protein product [Trichobilharzia regenti]
MLTLIYKEYQNVKSQRKAQLESKKQVMLTSINQVSNELLAKIDENVSKVMKVFVFTLTLHYPMSQKTTEIAEQRLIFSIISFSPSSGSAVIYL